MLEQNDTDRSSDRCAYLRTNEQKDLCCEGQIGYHASEHSADRAEDTVDDDRHNDHVLHDFLEETSACCIEPTSSFYLPVANVFHALRERSLIDHAEFERIGANLQEIVQQREEGSQWEESGEEDDVTELNDDLEIVFVQVGTFRLRTLDLCLRQGESLERRRRPSPVERSVGENLVHRRRRVIIVLLALFDFRRFRMFPFVENTLQFLVHVLALRVPHPFLLAHLYQDGQTRIEDDVRNDRFLEQTEIRAGRCFRLPITLTLPQNCFITKIVTSC